MENQPVVSTSPATLSSGIQPRPGSDDKTMALLAHLGGIFFGFIPSLIIWLVKKDESPYVDEQGKEALNFQIFIAICYFVSAILIVVLIGVLLLIVVGIFDLIFCIIAAVKASNGENYRYPLTVRFIK
jgi:uncharacterized Tic20 family protein